ETGNATYEHYEWPGDYFDKSEGEMLTCIRMEAQRSPGSRVLGTGKNIGIYPEIKAPWFHHQEGKDIAAKTLEVLKKYGYTGKQD
ncbi:contractile injection system protein, VgrG/Pvc8 family, partial [Salmonella enterica subsp. enterica serovar Kentucky]|nr:contractile injection system protein, VgrG/Pvc8 family [Salmonella enterica subsp. enterica serovar Kentucky]